MGSWQAGALFTLQHKRPCSSKGELGRALSWFCLALPMAVIVAHRMACTQPLIATSAF